MRPEGCQETGHAGSSRQDSPQPTDFKPFLASTSLDALQKRDLYSPYDQSACFRRRAVNHRLRARRGAARSNAQAIQRAMYVSALDRRRRADSGPRSLRFRRARGQDGARSPQGRAGRRSDADRDPGRHQPGARATTSRTCAPPCRLHQDPDDRRGEERSRDHRHRRAADDLHELHLQPGGAEEGHRSDLVDAGVRRLPARRRSSKPARDSRSAKRSARSSSPS